jgi:two-component system cell cycle sensor histidine kinase/response regulator CckA
MVIASANEAAQLSRQLLAYSRRQVLVPASFDLNLTVKNVCSMLARLVGETIQLSTALEAKQFAFTDKSQIEQVILNLAINARDAMPGGGRLTFETADVTIVAPPEPPAGRWQVGQHHGPRAGDYVKLVVSDTGTGIAADVIPHIFEPFFTTKSPGKGTGLGLSMVEGIVRQSGGAIDVTSQLGAGTRVSVYLPLPRAPFRRDRPSSPRSDPTPGASRPCSCVTTTTESGSWWST